jgi:hypothetical protein
MTTERGHSPDRLYISQSGDLHLNSGRVFDSDETDVSSFLGAVQIRTTHLDRAQLLALNTTRVELAPAPVGGRGFIEPLFMVFRLNAGSVPYTATGTVLHFGQNIEADGTNGISNLNAQDFFAQSDPYIYSPLGFSYRTVVSEGAPLQVIADGPLTVGDGTVDVTLAYVVV